MPDGPFGRHLLKGKRLRLFGEGVAAYQLVGGVMAYQGDDG